MPEIHLLERLIIHRVDQKNVAVLVAQLVERAPHVQKADCGLRMFPLLCVVPSLCLCPVCLQPPRVPSEFIQLRLCDAEISSQKLINQAKS